MKGRWRISPTKTASFEGKMEDSEAQDKPVLKGRWRKQCAPKPVLKGRWRSLGPNAASFEGKMEVKKSLVGQF